MSANKYFESRSPRGLFLCTLNHKRMIILTHNFLVVKRIYEDFISLYTCTVFKGVLW